MTTLELAELLRGTSEDIALHAYSAGYLYSDRDRQRCLRVAELAADTVPNAKADVSPCRNQHIGAGFAPQVILDNVSYSPFFGPEGDVVEWIRDDTGDFYNSLC